MEKMKMQSENLVDENVEKIAKLFPNCITEGKDENGNVVRAVDFDLLKQELSKNLVEGNDERYTLNWAGKKQAILTANSPINATLRPCKEECVGKDGTNGGFDSENLYIEGDNLDVLKLLRETYLNKIKMIYIDPPYNTGNDFVYNDDFATSADEYLQNSKSYDDDGNRMVQNLESNGRFHSDWLSMMYPRLKLARDLLTDDGVIFISIDDNEQANLKKICDEIFGANNFVAQIIIEGTPKNDPKIVSTAHEYCLVYVKNFDIAKDLEWGINNPIYEDLLNIYNSTSDYKVVQDLLKKYYKDNGLSEDNISNYKFADKQGIYRIGPIDDPQRSGAKDIRFNPYTGEKLITPNRGWSCNLETWNSWIKDGLIEFPENNTKLCSKKTYIQKGQLDLLRTHYKIQTRKDTDMLTRMFDGKKVFSFPKPLSLIKMFIDSSIHKDDIVLDFFSGSGTTAHSVISLNAERKNNLAKFILVQMPEDLNLNLAKATSNREKQVCQNAIDFCNKYNRKLVLTEIGKERIRRAGKKIKEENPDILNLDIGFRVLKLDSSNMKDVYYTPAETPQASLLDLVSNIKEDRSPEDLLFQVMLDMGVMLDSKIEKIELSASKQAFNVNDGNLICCFDINLSEEDVTKIAKLEPLYAVFRDSSMSSDSVAVNFDQIFETYSPSTTRKVL